MNISRIFGYIGIVWGFGRLLEYVFLGDTHGGYALWWMVHAFISGIVLLWMTRKETIISNKSKSG